MEFNRVKTLFLEESDLPKHLSAQRESYSLYSSVLLLLLKYRVELSIGTKTRILAASIVRNDSELTHILLNNHKDDFSLPEVLKAVKLLDVNRQLRQEQRRLYRLEKQGTARPSKINKLKVTIHNLQKETGDWSFNGSTARFIRRWIREIPADRLEFFATSLPKESWKELADLVHPSPQDFQLDWFLPWIFGANPPADTILAKFQKVNKDNLLELIQTYKPNYSFVRRYVVGDKKVPLSNEVKAEIARYVPIDTLVWYWEDLTTSDGGVDKIAKDRLESGEKITFNYGKLMERLMTMKSKKAKTLFSALLPIAERRLELAKLDLEPPVAILGDASASMTVAIQTSSIIASLLTALCDAELSFFHDQNIPIMTPPRTVDQVLELSQKIRAERCTAPAASLYPYYAARKAIKWFIIVTDEYENTGCHGYNFASLFKKYRQEVSPDARLVFLSFVEKYNQNKDLPMVTDLKRTIPGIEKEMLLFRLNKERPDLTRLDVILSLMSCESQKFKNQSMELSASDLVNQYNKLFGNQEPELVKETITPDTTGTTVTTVNVAQDTTNNEKKSWFGLW